MCIADYALPLPARMRAFTVANLVQDALLLLFRRIDLGSVVDSYRLRVGNNLSWTIIRAPVGRYRFLPRFLRVEYRRSLNLRTTVGIDLQAKQMGDNTADTGTTTSAPTATTATDTGKAWTTNQWKDHVVYMAGNVYAVVVSNTATVLTFDRWINPATPGGSAPTTPTTGAYTIAAGAAPACWIAITSTNITPAVGDTTLSGETTTNGLIRRYATYAHTGGVTSYAESTTFTYSSSTPVTIYGGGLFNAPVSGTMQFESLLNASATLNNSGDQLVIATAGWTVNI